MPTCSIFFNIGVCLFGQAKTYFFIMARLSSFFSTFWQTMNGSLLTKTHSIPVELQDFYHEVFTLKEMRNSRMDKKNMKADFHQIKKDFDFSLQQYKLGN